LADIVKLLRDEVNSMRIQLAAQTAAIAQLTATNAQQMQMIMQLTAGNTHSTASGGIMVGSHALSTSPAMTATAVPMSAPKSRTPRVDPAQPSMRSYASPVTIATSNTFASFASTSAPTTPVASPRALSLASPIAPIRDEVQEHTTVTTPRRSKAGAGSSGRKRVQSVSPSRSPLDIDVRPEESRRRASASTPSSAANLSQRMDDGTGNAKTPAQHDTLITKLTKTKADAKRRR
jgi:hypothetical protein